MSNRLHMPEAVCKFLSGLNSDALLHYDKLTNTTYIFCMVDGIKVVALRGVKPPWDGDLLLPAQITVNLRAGYYSVMEHQDYKLIQVFTSDESDAGIAIMYNLYHNITYIRPADLLPLLTNSNYLSKVIPDEIIIMYSIVSQIGSTINRAIEIRDGMAYMNAKGVNVVIKDLAHSNISFSLTKGKMNFINMFKPSTIKVRVDGKQVVLRHDATSSLSFYSIFGRMTTSSPPNLKVLDKQEPVFTSQATFTSLFNMLASIKENKHIPLVLRVSTDGICSVRQGLVDTIIPVAMANKPTIGFSVDACTFKKCIAKIKSVCTFSVYRDKFTIEAGKLLIVGEVSIEGVKGTSPDGLSELASSLGES